LGVIKANAKEKKVIIMDKNNKKIIIQETKCTCKACGNVWFYGKEEIAQNASNSMENCGTGLENCGSGMQNTGKSMMCCSGCAPAVFIPKQQEKPLKEIEDLGRCPKCNSRAVVKEKITHQI